MTPTPEALPPLPAPDYCCADSFAEVLTYTRDLVLSIQAEAYAAGRASIAMGEGEAVGQLKSALNGMLTFFGMDEDENSKPVFDKARAAMDAECTPYTTIDMGFGKWEVGAGTNAGTPCIAFGVHGSGKVGELVTIEPRQMSAEETYAVITFANYEGFAVLQEKMDEVRSLYFTTPQPAPAAPVSDGQRETAQRTIRHLLNSPLMGNHRKGLEAARAILSLRPAPALCKCGDRPADQCDEEWGPKCDLGNNPKHARPAPAAPAVPDRNVFTVNLMRHTTLTKAQARALISHWLDGVEPDPVLFAPAAPVSDERVSIALAALDQVANWDLPRVPDSRSDEPGATISYAHAYGSKGEEDYMRSLAATAAQRVRALRPAPAQPMSDEQIEGAAHRTCSRYKHDTHPSYVEYTFQRHTLQDFVRALRQALAQPIVEAWNMEQIEQACLMAEVGPAQFESIALHLETESRGITAQAGEAK